MPDNIPNPDSPTPGFDVAVIVPTFNRPDYLPLTLDSVIRQQFDGRIEIIVIDDGSTDNTSTVAIDYARRYDHPDSPVVVRYIRQRNQGQGVARNTGIAAASAPLIAFLDDDDLCEPNRIAQQVQLLRDNPSVCVVHSSFRYIDSTGRFTDEAPQRLSNPCVGHCAHILLAEFVIIFSTVMTRRATLLAAAEAEPHGKVFDPDLFRSEDADLLLRLARLGLFEYIPQPLVRYRVHAGNNAMSPANIATCFEYHCRVQIDFARRWGPTIGVTEQKGRDLAAEFLYRRAESMYWQRRMDTARQLCALARTLNFADPRFADLEARAAMPAWMCQLKDQFDRLRSHP